MEKKGNRNTSSSARGLAGTDLKKSQDVAIGKQGLRGAVRRREPSCGFSKSNEVNSKVQQQRNAKASDKRPKPRGLYYAGATPRNEEASLGNFEEPELGSVFSPGSKKQSLNHLINFSFAPRENYLGIYQSEKNSRSKQSGNWLITKKHKYNKDHFLQANCQFIVNEKGDYKHYMNNPDTLVDWNLIEQVNVQVNEEPSCPICLYPPVAAKMTKCGHVYCWPCILHYLALSDKDWRKCPICYDAVKKDDLKSVVAIPHTTFKLNDIITFKLMRRQRGSLIVFPADDKNNHLENKILYISDKHRDNSSSKLFLANAYNILDILERENMELDMLIREDAHCPERCFIEEAKQVLNSRRNSVLEMNAISEKESNDRLNETLSQMHLNRTHSSLLNTCNEICSSLNEMEVVDTKFYYFYQAQDGQHIYLHAINAKMLEHTYGSLEFGPKTLSGRIMEKEGGSMTNELRKKLRYLQHLPVTCQFEVAEIKLCEPIVNKETLEYFKDQIELRKKRRQQRAKEERKREKRIEAEENRKIGKFDSPDLQLESRTQFPAVKESHDMFPEYLDNRTSSESEATCLTPTESDSPDRSPNFPCGYLDNCRPGPSFATMLASDNKSAWPNLNKVMKHTNQSSSTQVKLIPVIGSSLLPSNVNRRHDSDSEQQFDPVPDFNRSFGDALAEVFAKGLENMEEADNNDVPASSKKKKKKKNKQKLLFTTHKAFPTN